LRFFVFLDMRGQPTGWRITSCRRSWATRRSLGTRPRDASTLAAAGAGRRDGEDGGSCEPKGEAASGDRRHRRRSFLCRRLRTGPPRVERGGQRHGAKHDVRRPRPRRTGHGATGGVHAPALRPRRRRADLGQADSLDQHAGPRPHVGALVDPASDSAGTGSSGHGLVRAERRPAHAAAADGCARPSTREAGRSQAVAAGEGRSRPRPRRG
jgi:hypothetical protein